MNNVDLTSLPSDFPSTCLKTTGSGGDVISAGAPAYQMASFNWGDNLCYRAGAEISIEATYQKIKYGLVDPVKPASGWYIEYNGGNTCSDTYSDKDECTSKMHAGGVTYCERSFRSNQFQFNPIKSIGITIVGSTSSAMEPSQIFPPPPR